MRAKVVPAGRAYVSTPLAATLGPLLVMRIWRLAGPSTGTLGVSTDKVTARSSWVGTVTVRMAVLLVVPVPPSFDDTAPVVFGRAPAPTPVTLTAKLQEPFTAKVPPLRLMEEEPA